MLNEAINVSEKQLYAIKIPGIAKYPKIGQKRGVKFFDAIFVVGEISPVEYKEEIDKYGNTSIQEYDPLFPFSAARSATTEESISKCGWASTFNFNFEYDNDDTIYSNFNPGEIPKGHILVNLYQDDLWLAKLTTYEKIVSIIDRKYIPALIVNILEQMGEGVEESGWKFRDMIIEKILTGFEKCGIVFKDREKFLPSYDGIVSNSELLLVNGVM